MKTKQKLALFTLLVVASAGSIAVATLLLKPARALGPGETLPDRDIVFVIGEEILGFINSDGSGYTIRRVDLPDWRWHPFTTAPDLEDDIVWGPNGEFLIGRYSVVNLGSGIPLLIYTDGTLLKCPDDETSPYAEGRSWGISGKTILTTDQRSGQTPDKVVLVDMASCEVISTVYTAKSDETLREATISSKGWLAISRYFHQRDEVVVIKPNSTVVLTLPDALAPAWSPNGEWLAYSIYEDGLYIMRKDGTDIHKVVDNPLPRTPIASWSPDGQWLVYSRDVIIGGVQETAIFKLNLSEGKEYELFKGGYNPDWRWKDSAP